MLQTLCSRGGLGGGGGVGCWTTRCLASSASPATPRSRCPLLEEGYMRWRQLAAGVHRSQWDLSATTVRMRAEGATAHYNNDRRLVVRHGECPNNTRETHGTPESVTVQY